jgi:prepilin-type N-terminal cleavage/methylation domain-containing protein
MKKPSFAHLADHRGFTLIELMISTLLFSLIAGVVFTLLGISQQRYMVEKDYLNSFQQANVAMDQITRDVHSAGYPPPNSFTAAVALANPLKVATPFAWSPTGAPCTVGVCASPGAFDLITESDLGNGNGVQWIRYTLVGTTLFRGIANKSNLDPIAATSPFLVPYLENVMNNPSAAQMTALQGSFPGMFPGNAAVPVFTYTFDAGTALQPPNIRELNITLIVQSPRPDPQTQRLRVVTLTGQATRINPNQ